MAQVVEFHGSLCKWSWAQCSTMLNIIIFQPEFNKGSSVNYLSPLSVIKTLNLFFFFFSLNIRTSILNELDFRPRLKKMYHYNISLSKFTHAQLHKPLYTHLVLWHFFMALFSSFIQTCFWFYQDYIFQVWGEQQSPFNEIYLEFVAIRWGGWLLVVLSRVAGMWVQNNSIAMDKVLLALDFNEWVIRAMVFICNGMSFWFEWNVA